jgi:hypothetical protein
MLRFIGCDIYFLFLLVECQFFLFLFIVDEIPRTSDASGADNHSMAVDFKPNTTLSNVSKNILVDFDSFWCCSSLFESISLFSSHQEFLFSVI